jgi:hypothetical protein
VIKHEMIAREASPFSPRLAYTRSSPIRAVQSNSNRRCDLIVV